ncbi:MAG TPA: cytochrome c oxidase assembly protein [Candidatus Nanopelagicaceae bacterium]|nr:cytochrome c oxidase assembly protein [Candidatus Nanopelagicaceae bacterium]
MSGASPQSRISTGRRVALILITATSLLSLVLIGDGRSNSAIDVTRVCFLLIVIPLSLFAAVPSHLLLRARGRWGLRLVDSPLVAPILTPVLLGLYFFTPIWVLVLSHVWFYLLSYPLLLIAGFILHVGLKGSGRTHSSTAFGLQILFSLIDLTFDAIPGIVMRLSHRVIGASYWNKPPSTPSTAMHHQLLAGAVLWFIAEASDLPILAMVFVRWIRVDEAEARRIDALLDSMEE